MFNNLNVQEDNALSHNVGLRLIYLSTNLWECSHLGYKVEGVAFYANKMKGPRKKYKYEAELPS